MSKEGLNIHYYENKKNLVVFIHGLFGSDATWENNSKEYLTDILYKRREIKGNFDLGNFNYKSVLKKKYCLLKKYLLSIEEISQSLKSEIEFCDKDYDNIILIGHSMGGLIAKQYLLNNLDNNKVKLYISIATPHLGSDLANFVKVYNHPQINELERNGDYLVNLNREWINQTKNLPESYYLYGLNDKVVDRKSSVPDESIDEKYIYGFKEDHTSIVKQDENSRFFSCIVKILNKFYLKSNPEKIILLNNSKKILNDKKSFDGYIDEGYQIVETLSEKNRNKIFETIGVFTRTLKNKDEFENYLKNFQKEMNVYIKSTSKLIYTGIPLIPLAFYEGYIMKTITDIKYLVNYREHRDKGYEELKYGNKEVINYNKSKIEKIQKKCREVSINLSSSFEVNSKDIHLCKKIPILDYKRNKIECDHLTHYKEVEKIADDFLEYILMLKNTKNIKRINIFAAIPATLAYEIGRKIENHYPCIYVYNYENGKYEWGLNIKTGELEIV